MEQGLMETNINEYPLFAKGKVRDVYNLDDKLLIVATDRISAFDVVLPTGIPGKGKVLTQMSLFWFDLVKNVAENHLITANVDQYPNDLKKHRDVLDGRSMLVKKAKRIDIECVVRGYIAGSLWKEYKNKAVSQGKSNTIELYGVQLPSNLTQSQRLPYPVFTPTTKAEEGHDESLTFEQVKKMVGEKQALELRSKSIRIYKKAADYAERRGMIIADTKFEFGILDGKLILIDEIFSSDSSRFWDKRIYRRGRPQEAFDKQIVRDYLESIHWNKKPPAPPLPEEVVAKTLEKYQEAYQRLVK
ncbi:MAG: phosphoribosylaminoimidazole-succinocarboxamide synthase [candidate division Zixibacteria bacterium SM23_73_3]|nr:MAG: phosphoribosylaminoimidazole-succinocarboxamide synthase [candidate division Zixibacteria bacterium SM23_73_3]